MSATRARPTPPELEGALAALEEARRVRWSELTALLAAPGRSRRQALAEGTHGRVNGFFERAFASDGTAASSEEDPDLFEDLPPSAQRDAFARAVVRVLPLRRGPWDGRVPGARDAAGHLGLLVLEGTMIRNVRVARQPRSELVGQGDLTRPWEHDGAAASMPFEADWRVLEPARLAILDERFLAIACRWPTVVSAILGRAVRRSHGLALQLAISDVRHIEPRLLLLFWHLADRWGRVGRDGVTVPLRLTHEVIAQLVGAQRPTVSTALQGLAREGSPDPPRRPHLAARPAFKALHRLTTQSVATIEGVNAGRCVRLTPQASERRRPPLESAELTAP